MQNVPSHEKKLCTSFTAQICESDLRMRAELTSEFFIIRIVLLTVTHNYEIFAVCMLMTSGIITGNLL